LDASSLIIRFNHLLKMPLNQYNSDDTACVERVQYSCVIANSINLASIIPYSASRTRPCLKNGHLLSPARLIAPGMFDP
jgi:hypothetical protein